jgi:exosortase A-associated hydrolase 2
VETVLEPFFLTTAKVMNRLFAIHHSASGVLRGLVVYVHPFAEEMNKSRRMAARQARQLASNGYAVIQVDLPGCGDSEGDLSLCTWDEWIEAVVAATAWLASRHGVFAPGAGPRPNVWLWGLRAGALFAAAAIPGVRALGLQPNLLFWQPVTSGRVHLHQFLRLKVATEMLTGQARSGVEQLRAQLAQGQVIDVAGYSLGPSLCLSLEAAALAALVMPDGAGCRAVWFDVQAELDEGPSSVFEAAAMPWAAQGWQTSLQRVQGPPFWQTTEIEDAPALLAATSRALDHEGLAC